MKNIEEVEYSESSNKKIAMRVSIISIFVNIALSVFKFIAGILANSGAMISDAVHSASDVLSTFVVIIGVNISGQKADHEHQYGHDRLECVAAILLAVILFATGVGIGWTGIEKIMDAESHSLEIPGILALVAAVVSIGVKEWMYWFTRAAANKINSSALKADAWHHRSDALSSIGSLIGIALSLIHIYTNPAGKFRGRVKKDFTNRWEFVIIDKHSKSDPVAQLEERYLDMVEVVGSSPIGITIN